MAIGFGVIGCGAIGAWHCIAIQAVSSAQLIGVTDAFPASAQKFSERFGVPAYASVDDMLRDHAIQAKQELPIRIMEGIEGPCEQPFPDKVVHDMRKLG